MKIYIFILTVILNFNYCFSQITGSCIDTLGNPLPYVNIAIKNTSEGTVTNAKGLFTIDNKFLLKNDTIIFSHIGYETKTIVVSESVGFKIIMQQADFQLDEVNIEKSIYKFTRKKKIGNNVLSKHVLVGFSSHNLGTEIGKFFNVKKRHKKYKIQRIRFSIAELGYKKGTFRINFYNVDDEGNIEMVRSNKNDILMEVSKIGDVDIDVREENLIFENNFLVAIECVNLIENNSVTGLKEKNIINFSSNVFCGPVYLRGNNTIKWVSRKQKYNLGLGIQLFVKY